MIHWLVQSTGLRRSDEMTDRLLSGIEAGGATWCDFGVIPFTTEVTNWQNFPLDKKVFVHCSTRALKIFTDDSIDPCKIFVGADQETAEKIRKWVRSGIYYDERRFDMAHYIENKITAQFYLNGSADVVKIRDLMDMSFSTDKFIKPGKDLKQFTGGIVPRNTKFRDYLSTLTYDSSFHDKLDEIAIVSNPVEILAEWRFFIHDFEIVAESQYRKFGQLKLEADVPWHVLSAAAQLSMCYAPSQSYVMDIALTGDLELKIVEYNCINCAGPYKANISDLTKALSR